MTKKPVTGRILALLTAVLTMTVMCLPASAFAANGITKDETVYVVTDSSGTQQDVIVSDHLINKGKVKTRELRNNYFLKADCRAKRLTIRHSEEPIAKNPPMRYYCLDNTRATDCL